MDQRLQLELEGTLWSEAVLLLAASSNWDQINGISAIC